MICEEKDCKCKATHHLRYINSKPDTSDEWVAIEKGNITYKSVCMKHWMQKKNVIYGY